MAGVNAPLCRLAGETTRIRLRQDTATVTPGKFGGDELRVSLG